MINNIWASLRQLANASILPQVQVTELNNEQIKALPTTPVVVVPAISGKIIIPIYGFLHKSFAVEYTNIGAASYLAFYAQGENYSLDTIPNATSAYLTDFLDNGIRIWTLTSRPQVKVTTGWSDNFKPAYSPDIDYINTPITMLIDDDNTITDLTGGDPANKLKVVISYYAVNLY